MTVYLLQWKDMKETPSYITDYLKYNAESIGTKPAIIFKDQTTTWEKLWELVQNTSNNEFSKIHSDSQKIVAILLPNSLEFVVAYLSIVHAGHIAMPLDPNFKKLEAQNVVDQMKPQAIITDSEHLDFFEAPHIWDIKDLMSLKTQDSELKPIRLPGSQQVVSMLFTSGTTGNPKATPYTHANHLWNIQAISKLWQWTSEDTLLVSLPLSHWHGLCVGITGMLVHGNTMYLQERFDPANTLEVLTSGLISMFMHVPIAYSRLIDHNPNETFDISSVRLCISGSSFLPPAMWHKFKQRYGQEILERYGASEMGFLTSNSLDSRIPGSVGKPLSGVDINIQKSGEIAMRSPGLFPGYYQNEAATKAQKTKTGYWLSGDIGEFDKDGNIHLKGRVQEKMKKFGYTVYPRDVEWALMQDSRVREAVVMSIQSDTELSDRFVFFVVGELDESDVYDISKTNMPNFWRPDTVFMLEAIPRTGRASKPALKELRELALKD